MSESIRFTKQRDYLLVTLSDTVITPQRAEEILTRISDECTRHHFRKVLLDELTVERREVNSHDIMKLSAGIASRAVNKIYMAFLCQPHLVNADADKLSLYTYANEYIIRHFSMKEDAVAWLKEQRG
jgi:hypothetical protein